MKNPFIKLIMSLLKTITIASIVAYIAHFFTPGYVLWGAITFLIQFIAFYMLNVWLEYKARKDARELAVREAEVVAQNTITVTCANCKKESDILIRTNRENRYICGHCNTKNVVYILAETAVVTEPLYDAQPLPNTSSTNGIDK